MYVYYTFQYSSSRSAVFDTWPEKKVLFLCVWFYMLDQSQTRTVFEVMDGGSGKKIWPLVTSSQVCLFFFFMLK